jgi:hypothetical protein
VKIVPFTRYPVLCMHTQTIHGGTGRSAIVSGPSIRAGLSLQELWQARCDFELSDVRCRTVRWRVGRSVIMCGLSDHA